MYRGAQTSFSPAGYFGNPDADRPKWERLLASLPAGGAPSSVLDVGCGSGAFLAYLGQRFPSIRKSGIELDAARAESARKRNAGASIHAGDALTVLRDLDAQYDLVTLWDVIEHVPDPAALLQALATRLAPGGTLFVQTIHEDSVVPRLGRLAYRLSGGFLRAPLRRTHDAHHLVFFSRRGLGMLAQAAGLVSVATWFDRLAPARMDGSPLLTLPTAALLWLENRWGNGLFVNVILRVAAPGGAPAPRGP
jgi:SAM-dependent methyltransferase